MTHSRAAALLALALAGGTAYAGPEAAETVVQGVAHDALFAVAFDGASGIAAGAPGRILNSADGGKTWVADKTFPTLLAMLGADLKAGKAIAVGQMGTVAIREGSGAWKKVESGTTERLMSVSLNRKGMAVAVGSFGAMIKSADGGASWQSVAIDWKPYLSPDQLAQGIQPHLFAVQVSDDGVITAAGELSLILRSADGGASWKAVSNSARSGTDAAVFALDLRSDGVGFAVGQDGLTLRSADGGANWAKLPAAGTANLLGVRSVGDKIVVSAMHDMLTSVDGGQSWQRVKSQDVQSGWYSGVGATDSAFLAVGHTGRIIKINL